MEQQEIYETGKRLVSECEAFCLGILDDRGRPRLYAMQKAIGTSPEEVIFITKAGSEKVKLLHADNRAAAEFHKEEESVSLTGRIRIVAEPVKMRELLTEELIGRLEARGFQRYCVLQFLTEEYTVYREGEVGTCRFDL